MKKSLAFLLAVMMLLSLAACGSKEPPTATALDGMLTQNYYFQRVGKHMAVIVVSYSPSVTDAAAIDSMLGGV